MRNRMKEMEDRMERIERGMIAILQRMTLPIPQELAAKQLDPIRIHFPDELLARFDNSDDQ